MHTSSYLELSTHSRPAAGAMGILLLLTGLFVAGTVRAQDAAAPAPGIEQRLDSTARLLAGLPPTHAEQKAIAESAEWQEHSRVIQSSWTRVRDGQLAAMIKWREAELPKQCPVGDTVFYPFSGPDFLNVFALYPGCTNFVLFGLERTGVAPDPGRLKKPQLTQLLNDVRDSMVNLFERNYFVTGTMSKQLHTSQLRGVVPILMISMALSGVEVVRVGPAPFKAVAAPAPSPEEKAKGGRWGRGIEGVTIEFRVPGSTQLRRLHYYSLDATDAGLARYPEFLDHLRGLGSTTTLLKAASYLLHGSEFRRMRDVVLENTRFLVQDDTGLPYALLRKQGFDVKLYGTYGVPIKPFEYAFQKSLAAAFEAEKPAPLPFLFGYQRSRGVNYSHLMLARRPAAPRP